MNKNVNPPFNSSLAISCAKSVTTSLCGEGKVAALFTEGVSNSTEGDLAIDETASTVSLAPNVCVVPGVSTKARSVSTIWVLRRALRVILFWKEKLMTMIVLLIQWAVSLQSAMLSWRAGRLQMRWHVLTSEWRRWQRVLSTHLDCQQVSLLYSLPISFESPGKIWWSLIFLIS